MARESEMRSKLDREVHCLWSSWLLPSSCPLRLSHTATCPIWAQTITEAFFQHFPATFSFLCACRQFVPVIDLHCTLLPKYVRKVSSVGTKCRYTLFLTTQQPLLWTHLQVRQLTPLNILPSTLTLKPAMSEFLVKQCKNSLMLFFSFFFHKKLFSNSIKDVFYFQCRKC